MLCTAKYKAEAQRYNLSTFTMTHGLLNNQVTCIWQDDIGYLWVGTAYGLCRFNGIQFLKFDTENPVSTHPIRSIYQDKDGRIWIGMLRRGVAVFSGVDFTFYTTRNGILSDNIHAIVQDHRGRIWLGTTDGISILDSNGFSSFTISNGLSDNHVTDLKVQKDGVLWIATMNGVTRWHNDSVKIFTAADGLNSSIVYHIFITTEGTVYFSTQRGISIYQNGRFSAFDDRLGNERFQAVLKDRQGVFYAASYHQGLFALRESEITHLTTAHGLPGSIILSALADKENNVWLGTMKGLCRYSGDRFITYSSDDGLAGNHILSAHFSQDKRYWFGTLTNGLSVFDGVSFKNIGRSEGLPGKTIWHITAGYEDNLWLSTTSGPARINTQSLSVDYPIKFLKDEFIYFTLQTDTHRIYFSTDKGLFVRINNQLFRIGNKHGLSEEKVRYLFHDGNKLLWIGTLRGLYVLNEDSVFKVRRETRLPQVPVTGIISDADGRLIISTYDFGIYVIHAGQVENLNTQNGLYTARINRIFLDNRNWLWMATPDGVDGLNWADYVRQGKIFLTRFDKSNGYFGMETNAICSDTTGDLWFGSINGVIRFNRQAGLTKTSIPLLTLNKIQLFLKDVDWQKRRVKVNPRTGLPEHLVLPFDQNNLSFFFTGIYLSAPEEVKYRFILEGLDKDWSPVTNQSVAHYSNVPAGKFVFKVRATVNNREWSPAVTFSFEVKPPIWKTPVMIFFYVLGLAILIFLFLQWRTRSLQRAQNLLRKKVEERTRELNEKNIELEKLSLVASETDNAVILFNERLELEWANKAFTRMTGYTVEELNKEKPVTLYELSTHPDIHLLAGNAIEQRKSLAYESQLRTRSGETIWVNSTLNCVYNSQGHLKKVVVVDTDITYRKKMEEELKRASDEKGLLLKEIHHRVKNNLQIIISLFNLQSGFVTDRAAYQALREGQERIKSIALIHDRFYQTEGTSQIDFDEYIQRLCDNLLMSAGINPARIKFIIKADKISLDLDRAVPCGLIINEVVNNALRHAFPDDRHGVIEIIFRRENNHVLLKIRDNGVGMKPGNNLDQPETLGLQLIHVLAEQLDAAIETDTTQGVAYSFRFACR
jgi:PAS domain S-box-containing protein